MKKFFEDTRLNSPVVLTSFLGVIFGALTNLGMIEIPNDTMQSIINIIITVLVSFGVVNNPTTKDKF